MARLTPEERAELEARLAADDGEDDDESYEVEWWEEDAKGNRRGGRLPWSQGKKIYGKYAPDLFEAKPPGEAAGEGEPAKPGLRSVDRKPPPHFRGRASG